MVVRIISASGMRFSYLCYLARVIDGDGGQQYCINLRGEWQESRIAGERVRLLYRHIAEQVVGARFIAPKGWGEVHAAPLHPWAR